MVLLRKSRMFPFSQFFILVMSVMFIITIFLSFRLLTLEDCDHSNREITQPEDANLIEPEPNLRQGTKNHKLAVLVPFRERFEELLDFAPFMHSFLNKQNLIHDIFILNQIDTFRFNRASLINVGYLQVKDNYDYLAMHDVDLLPLNNNLSYSYPKQPFHVAAPELHPRYHYKKFIGGILLINREHFLLVNGLSNNYWGWGLEDDEFYVRLKDANLTVARPQNIATGINDTFKHIHSKNRKRDTTKCYNQRDITRRRDRKTGLHDVKYTIEGMRKVTIEDAPITVINIKLKCDLKLTPWCDCSLKKV